MEPPVTGALATRFLFWNMRGKDLSASLGRLCELHRVTFLLLAECEVEPGKILAAVNSKAPRYRLHPEPSGVPKITMLSTLPPSFISFLSASSRMLLCHVSPSGGQPYLIAAVHLPSKMHQNDASQALGCTIIAAEIRTAEQQVGHDRTLLIGDLNMNPFEPGMISASGFHAVMDSRIANAKTRTLEGRDYPFFYNPSWGMMGDRTPGPPGSYYYRRAEHVCYFWNTFDQALIRPSLLSEFRAVKLLESDGQTSFLKKDGTPHTKAASDHLPLLLEMLLQ